MERYYVVRNSVGRRFHAGTDKGEAEEVCTRLEAQLRGVSAAGAVGGATPTLVDVPEHTVTTEHAPSRESVAEAIGQGVPTPGTGTPTGESITGNEVDERRAAELRAATDEPEAAAAFGVTDAVKGSTEAERTTQLEPRPVEPEPTQTTSPEPGVAAVEPAGDDDGLPAEGSDERAAADASAARSRS